MNDDLERRLRSAFDARARTFEASPDAWSRVREREPRRSRARWLVAALPVALLTVFVPILLNGGLGRNTANDPGELYRQIMSGRTAAGESVTVADPAGGGRLRLWFARGRMGNPELCYIVEQSDSYGSCDGMRDLLDRAGWFAGSTARTGARTSMDYGVARQNATSVAAVTKGGRTIEGELLRPAGAPSQIWTVTYPAQDPVSKVSFTDTDGRTTEMPRSILGRGAQIDRPLGPAVELPGGLTVGHYQENDGPTLFWTRHGETVGAIRSASEQLLKAGPLDRRSAENLYFGVARKDVATIRMTTAGGATATATTRPDPWNLSVGLFALVKPGGWEAGHRIAAYDATGKEIWHIDHGGRDSDAADIGMRKMGDVITLPGTEQFGHGPVRVWFVKEGSSNHLLCVSGGVGPDGSKRSGCASASFDDPNNFTHNSVDTYLPDPGATVRFGTAGADWESIDAVLPDGRRLSTWFVSGKGAPARVWYFNHLMSTRIAAFAIKLKGRQLERIVPIRHDCLEVKQQEGQGHTMTQGITAVLHAGNCVRFWKDGKAPVSYEPIPGGKLSAMIAAERPLQWGQVKGDWYGFALPGTARIEVTLQDGGTATATAERTPDPWGQGVVLFAGTVPEKAGKRGISWPGMRFTGFDEAGRELWTYEPKGP
ncbi:hypothetical protein GCM10022419_018980 [Nonomuraea rosea]|uniref:Uncharacterized protein n=1 Tax=Nonomuraea rosea TaxID=638574 RepID=A0ABP6VSV6_9ACTN